MKYPSHKKPAPRLFIIFNSCTIIILLTFLLLQGLLLKPLPSISFMHIVLPDHTRHYIHSQIGLNVVQIYTTFFSTCYRSIPTISSISATYDNITTSSQPSIKLDCSWHSFYFNWNHFLGTPDVIYDSQSAVASIDSLSRFKSNYSTSIELHKIASIASAVCLIVTISSRFLMVVFSLLVSHLPSCLHPTGKLSFLSRLGFIFSYYIAAPTGLLLAPICMFRSSFHIYNDYYGTGLHPSLLESTFNIGLHALLWLVSFFSILDIKLAQIYTFQLAAPFQQFPTPSLEDDSQPPGSGPSNYPYSSHAFPAFLSSSSLPPPSTSPSSPSSQHPYYLTPGQAAAGSSTDLMPSNDDDWFPFRTSTSSNRSMEPSILRNPFFGLFRAPQFSTQANPSSSTNAQQPPLNLKPCFDNNQQVITNQSLFNNTGESSRQCAPGQPSANPSLPSLDDSWPASWTNEKNNYKYSPSLFKPGSRQNLESDSELSDDDDRASTSESLTLSDNNSLRTSISRTGTFDDDSSDERTDSHHPERISYGRQNETPPPYSSLPHNSSLPSLADASSSSSSLAQITGTTLVEYGPDLDSNMSDPPSLVYDNDGSSSYLSSSQGSSSASDDSPSIHNSNPLLSNTPLHVLDNHFSLNQDADTPTTAHRQTALPQQFTFHQNYFGTIPPQQPLANDNAPVPYYNHTGCI